jgi:group I intron endonuclease
MPENDRFQIVEINPAQQSLSSEIHKSKRKRPAAYVILIADKIYVGSSGSVDHRLIHHRNLLKRGEHWINGFQQLYDQGFTATAQIHHTQNRDQAYLEEQRILNENTGKPNLLNTAIDVKASTKGLKRDPEVVEKLRASNLGKQVSEETRLKISQQNTGRKLSETTRKRMSDSKKGKPPSLAAQQAAIAGRSRAVICQGVEYAKMLDAAKALNLSPSVITKRVRDDRFPDFKFK